jgi:hypothetical protein
MSEIPEINIRHFLILALGGSQYLHPIIEDMYQENRLEYYEAYRNSGMYTDIIITRFITRNEEKMKQVSGIVEWSYLHNNFENLMKLIKKGYKYSYQFVQQRKVVDLGEFELGFTKKRGGMGKVTDLDLLYGSVVVLYLCNRENKICDMNNEYGHLFINGIRSLISESISRNIRFSPENRELYKKEVDELFFKYGIPRNMQTTSIGKFFEMFVEKQTDEKIKSSPLYNDMQEIREAVFQEGISRYIGSLSLWVRINGINEMDLTDSAVLTKEDVEIIFLDYVIASQVSKQITAKDRDLYIITLLYTQALALVYKETKHLYLDDSQEKHYLEIKQAQQHIEAKTAELNKQEAGWKKEKEDQLGKIAELQSELRKTQKTLQMNQVEMEKNDSSTKELAALRAYMYNSQQVNVVKEETATDRILSDLKVKRVAVFGGHPNWRNKLKEVLPNYTFIDVDSINRELTFVDNMDAVFVNYDHFNHKFYERLMKHMSRNDTILHYLSGSSNTDIIIRDIHKALFF